MGSLSIGLIIVLSRSELEQFLPDPWDEKERNRMKREIESEKSNGLADLCQLSRKLLLNYPIVQATMKESLFAARSRTKWLIANSPRSRPRRTLRGISLPFGQKNGGPSTEIMIGELRGPRGE